MISEINIFDCNRFPYEKAGQNIKVILATFSYYMKCLPLQGVSFQRRYTRIMV